MIEKFKRLSLTIKLFVALVIILIIGIILRWNYIKHEAARSFNFFKYDKDTLEVVK
jgi:hypothetical protein